MSQDAAPNRTQFIMMFFAFAFGMVLSNLIGQQSLNKAKEEQPEILFIYRGIEKTAQDIQEADRQKLAELNTQKQHLLERVALKQHIFELASKEGLTVEQAAEKILKWDEIKEEEISQFYQTHQHAIKKPFYEVKHEIKRKLEQQRAADIRADLIKQLTLTGDLAILPKR